LCRDLREAGIRETELPRLVKLAEEGNEALMD
jgi:hypothetical protein